MKKTTISIPQTNQIPEPPLSRFLFANTKMAPLWFLLRVYVGWEWVEAGWTKVTSPVWVGPHAGGAVKGFLMGALAKTDGPHPDVSSWYAMFIHNYALHHTTLFSNLVAYGELFVGIALLLGMFTGIAAFFGAFMNMNYLFAGTVSVNPLLFLCELLLILAWRTAGLLGLDGLLLPYLGVPWKLGKLFRKK